MTNISETSFRSVCCLLHESSFIFCISDLFDFCCKQFWGCGHINGTYIACLLMSQDLTEGTCKKLCPFICRVMGLVQLIIYEGGCCRGARRSKACKGEVFLVYILWSSILYFYLICKFQTGWIRMQKKELSFSCSIF